jgi:putative oxidoreductase
MNARKNWAALLGRILLAGTFVFSGFLKITGFEGTVGYIADKALPLPQVLAVIAILIECGGGLAIIAGWKTRLAAVAFIVFLIVITPIFHGYWPRRPIR